MMGASYTTHKYGLKYFKIETLDKSRKHLYNLVTRYVSYKEDPPQDGGIDNNIKKLLWMRNLLNKSLRVKPTNKMVDWLVDSAVYWDSDCAREL